MNAKSPKPVQGTVYYMSDHFLFWIIWLGSFLGFMALVIYDEGRGFHRLAIPFGLAVGLPVTWSLTWILRKLFPDRITPEGIEGHTCWGARNFIRWQDIQEARTFQRARFKYLRLNTGGDRRIAWIGIFHQRTPDFCQAIQRHAPPGNPIRKFVD